MIAQRMSVGFHPRPTLISFGFNVIERYAYIKKVCINALLAMHSHELSRYAGDMAKIIIWL